MLSIDIENKKSQSFNVNLSGQECLISIAQRGEYLYLSLQVSQKVIVKNVICLNNVRLIRYEYLGFEGDLFFTDTQGGTSPQNPNYTGLGTRFLLLYEDSN